MSREEAEANGYHVIDSDGPEDDGYSPPFSILTPNEPLTDAGNQIDDQSQTPVNGAEIVKPAERARRDRQQRETPTGAREPKNGPPNVDEWQRFIANVILRVGTEWYIAYAFRGIEEDVLTDREVDRLALTDEERGLISTPFAELANKSKFMRKHGRMIVASGDAFNALVVIGIWMSRVNRIANRHRPKVVRPPKGQGTNGSSGQGSPSPDYATGTTGGRITGQWPIQPGTG
ncbi:MAG TPA: hypothetical protein VNB49_10565 [Candidatus Dormibacteraeota bacterium]|nr:hypothetical protein [Candidatus Dormibacteraeota bacterium]